MVYCSYKRDMISDSDTYIYIERETDRQTMYATKIEKFYFWMDLKTKK